MDSLICIGKSPHFSLNAVLFLLFSYYILLKLFLISYTMKVRNQGDNGFSKIQSLMKIKRIQLHRCNTE